MKMRIQITKQSGLYKGEKIVEIDINNGNWKYWDTYMESKEKQSLTINKVWEVSFLNKPVKDAISIHDMEKWEQERKLVVSQACIRTYNSLLTYLNCRVQNFKKDLNKYGWKKQTWSAVLFEEIYVQSKENSVVKNIEFKEDGLIEVVIEEVED